MKPITILAIDTSCDDTSVAVTQNDRVLSTIVSSQIDVHKEWGGVVPQLARREHEKMIDGCIAVALKRARLTDMRQLDAIAVTYGPGLPPALEVGVTTAKALAIQHTLPVVAVNHMEGHALSALLKNRSGNSYAKLDQPTFPLLAVCVSGGHTEIILVEEIGRYQLIGQTLDDARIAAST
jgi:N6-L-threonylcarbamoyladenine synthase